MVWAISRSVRTAIADWPCRNGGHKGSPGPACSKSPPAGGLQTSEGKPFFYLSDTACCSTGREEEAETHLQDRADRGSP